MIERSITAELKKSLDFFPVLAIVGPRQVGKTTIAKSLRNQVGKEVIYLDLENPRDTAKLQDPVLFFENNEKICIILDEIQQMPELFPILRSMVDANRIPARYILLGSASPTIIRDSSESLAGRVTYKELTPFNLVEISSTGTEVNKHWLRGGFPDAYLVKNDELSFDWLENFIKSYITRDLPMLGLTIDSRTIYKLWAMVAHMHGSVLNMSNLGKSLGVSSMSIRKYLSFLEGAFLIRLLQPYATNLKKRLVKAPKVYIRDSGVLHELININSWASLEINPMLGNSWEGYALEQIIQNAGKKLTYYYYRTQDGAECDLVLVKSNKPIASIEIKYTASPKTSKGMLQSFTDLKAAFNFVITPNTD
ncbi:MAG: ATP-binding protein, partial [Cyclobacteriaceae bacterium]|nr:ATP-binding protein [Cyclobacteriaceae bacterium]